MLHSAPRLQTAASYCLCASYVCVHGSCCCHVLLARTELPAFSNLSLAGRQTSCLGSGVQAVESLLLQLAFGSACRQVYAHRPSSVDLIAEACSMYHRLISNASFVHVRLPDGSVAGEQLATAECTARSDGQADPKH